jgi:hypothetical protein
MAVSVIQMLLGHTQNGLDMRVCVQHQSHEKKMIFEVCTPHLEPNWKILLKMNPILDFDSSNYV